MYICIKLLKNFGYCPEVIFDIGEYHGNCTIDCLKIFPESKYNLFEDMTIEN